MKLPLLLRGPFSPHHKDNRMAHEGNVAKARKNFIETRFRNLDALLSQRYSWMNNYISDKDEVIELGCGAGFSRLYLNHGNLKLTDYIQNEWVDLQVDAMNPLFKANSIDVIICSHMIHHMARPISFFKLVHPILKDGGRIIIQDLNTSFAMRLLLWAMRHEGWSYDIDVFDENAVTNDPFDPWSANCATPELLFDSSSEFERQLPDYRVVLNKLNECFLFPLSGGVIAKTAVPELPNFILSAVKIIDKMLITVAPSTFAMGRSVVIEKK